MPIPIVDIFAGPGGLGEGFSALLNEDNERAFKIVLSIEKDEMAHRTLTLRSFFRQFNTGEAPIDYYDFLKGRISLEELYKRHPIEAYLAKDEAWHVTLGNNTSSEVDKRIKQSLNGKRNWLLVGGPPCQAYSIVGRSRRQETTLDGRKDKRVGLYKQYLRILAVHNPTAFVMENVKGLLSAETNQNPIFPKILKDLANPVEAYISDHGKNGNPLLCPGYKIYSLVVPPGKFDADGNPIFQQKDFIIKAENHGIPQARHRVILLGIRKDINSIPSILMSKAETPISKVLSGLPRLRSGLSKVKDSYTSWRKTLSYFENNKKLNAIDSELLVYIEKKIAEIVPPINDTGSEFLDYPSVGVEKESDWFIDQNLQGVCNHKSRSHMETDLQRYLFASCFAKINKYSPTLADFPAALLPKHKNVNEGIKDKKFADRFRVQLWNKPAKTVTSHISKDGHYYIHPDPTQCRSLTVREAARIQTFPDNYFFCGPRTSQFHQVGNAVPPLLAYQISKIVFPLLKKFMNERDNKHTKRTQNVRSN